MTELAAAPAGLELVRPALRANLKRRLLMVSSVLAKHLPTDPAVARLAGAALALRAAEDERLDAAIAALGGGGPDAAALVEDVLARPAALGPDVAVIGFAETATGLGHATADALDADLTLHTTRYDLGDRPRLVFDEAHSHAPDQALHAADALRATKTIVLVDDELTTGRTALVLIERLRELAPGARYVIAALVSAMPAERAEVVRAAGVDVVSLATIAPDPAWVPEGAVSDGPPARVADAGALPQVRDVTVAGVCSPGRLGATRADRPALHALAEEVAVAVAPHAPDAVLGTGELMYLPILAAARLGGGGVVPSWSTTRSPIRIGDGDGYPIRSGIAFGALDGADRTEFLYSVAGVTQPAIVFASPAERAGADGLLAGLAAAGARAVTCVTVTSG